MAQTALAVLQTPWDCRWSQPGHRLHGVADDEQPEGVWVCLRQGSVPPRRTVTDAECAGCPHWEMDVDQGAPAATLSLSTVARRAFPLAGIDEQRRNGSTVVSVRHHSDGVLSVLKRGVLLIAGVLLFATGVALSAPLILLPLGLPLAIVGLGVAIWGVSGEFTTGHQELESEAPAGSNKVH